jgi:zinc protease
MLTSLLRVLRFALLSCAGLALVASQPVLSKVKTAKPVAVAVPKAEPLPWLYQGSDIPVDKNWTFGTLPNGLRYAVRRNGVPPQQVSIRVAIDAGSMMERESELGYAHFIEHLSFRGSKHVMDGEAKRVWQRLGASFGSDTNAATTPTQTIYKLDLPSFTAAGLDESIKILSGMMSAPSITQAEVDAERRTVTAEARESDGAGSRASEAVRTLFFAGQPLGSRPPIGTTASLSAATSASLKAFQSRWYRPDKTVVVISGDGDPAEFVAVIKKHFSDWAPAASPAPDPDFGTPLADRPATRFMTEQGLPTSISLAWLRPWKPRADTIVYNQGKMVDLVALRLISRRLEERARAGGSFLQASADQDDVARSVDATFVSITPLGNDWKPALADVRAVIADALANPPSQADIDREYGEVNAALDVAVETARAEASAKQADDIVEAVNIRETVASPEVARDVFGSLKGKMFPADIIASTKRLFSGTGPRAIVSSQVSVPDGETQLAAAMAAPVNLALVKRNQTPVSFDALPKLGAVGTIKDTSEIASLGIKVIELSNGTRVVLNPSTAEAGRIYVSARFGAGRQAMPKTKMTPAWAGSSAMIASGIGTLGQDALDRMTSGRQINLSFDVDDDAFLLRGTTRPADLADQLRLMATKFAKPGWDPAPIARTRAALQIGLSTQASSPQGVMGRELNGLLRGGDKRWATPTSADIDALTPQSFRAFWEPLLATGPIELSIYGDFQEETAMAAVLKSFGALPPRPAAKPLAGGADAAGPKPTAKPLQFTHKGQADQAAVVVAWATGGGAARITESRQLEILAAIFNDRMFEQFREGEGATYSPDVSSSWPTGLNGGGSFTVASQVKPDGVPAFFKRVEAIAADLATKPVTADELARAVGPMRQHLARASSGNQFWLGQLSGVSTDRSKVEQLRSWPRDLATTTPENLQALAQRYLVKGKAMSVIITPQQRTSQK